MLLRLIREASRRRVFRTAALYIVGTWLVLQVADVLFPAFDITESAKRPLVWAAMLGFPVALVFGWLFDVGEHGIRRTGPALPSEAPASLRMERRDWLILLALVAVLTGIALEATRQVIEAPREVQTDATVATPASVSPAQRLENSIAVLPFSNISSDPENEFFCDGISEEILNRLGAFQGLNVIGRTSSYAFKGQTIELPRLSALLGVRFLLQGSVRKSGDSLRISVQLLDQDGVQRWQQSFDRQLKNVFAIQTEIADTVAATVAPQVAPPAVAGREPDLRAYEHYLRGRELLHRREVVGARKALRQAVTQDPQFAEAHAELAIALSMGNLGADDHQQSREAIDRALALQPGLLRAMAAEGLWLEMQEPPDYAAAERVLRRVLERDPNMSDALNWLSTALTHLGREEQAFAVLQRAARIDPLHPTAVVNLANRYLERGDSVRAEAELVRMLEIQDTPYSVLVALRELYEDQGRLVAYYDVARAQLDHGNFEHLYTQVLSYLLVGDAEHARYWAERTAREHPDFPASRFMGTAVPAMQGDFAKATAELHHVLAGAEMRFEDMAPFAQVWLARLPALAGNCGEGVPLLESALRADEATLPAPDVIAGIVFWVDAWHTLAWCLQHDGQEARAQAILEALERGFVQETAEGRHPGSGVWFRGARNALLQGDTARAFTRLERAVELGWRSYYLEIHNPLLAPLREHPGFAQLMETVRVDIERQRQEIERRDAIQSLAAVYDARLARERAAERGGSVPAGARSDDSAVRMPRN